MIMEMYDKKEFGVDMLTPANYDPRDRGYNDEMLQELRQDEDNDDDWVIDSGPDAPMFVFGNDKGDKVGNVESDNEEESEMDRIL